MPTSITQYDYIGSGRVSLRKKGDTTAPFAPLGNCSKVSLSVEEDKKTNQDYESTGGGYRKTLSRIKSVSLTLETTNLSPSNMVIGQRGISTSVSAVTAISDEAVSVVPGGISLLARMPDLTQTLTVASTDGETTYVENTDYTRTVGGIEVLSSGSIAAGSVNVSYAPLAESIIQALVESAYDYEVQVELQNEAMEDLAQIFKFHSVTFSPTASDLIGDDFGSISLSGDVQKDSSVVGSGLSKFYTIRTAVPTSTD